MRSPLLTKLSFAAGLLFAAGCGRSLLFNPVNETAGTTGGSAAASSSGGVTGGGTAGTSGGQTTGGGSSSGGVAGSSAGACGQVGTACARGSDCCGDYCRNGVCHCNKGDRGYPCRSDGDCCKPAVCGADGTCRTPKTGGGSAGGNSGGSGCTPGGATNELSPCQTGADCGCPLECTPTALGRSICEYACRSNTDCPSLYTTCRRGSCQPDVCGVSFGGQNGTLDGLCNSVGTDDGSCVPVQTQGFTVGLCLEGGSATQSCSLSATRADLSQACPAGELCAGSTCAQLCNPNGAVPCPSGGQCTAVSGQSPELGLCVGASGGIGGIGGGSSSGGSIGGGNGTSGGGGGGCNVGIPVQEMAPCTSGADCGCPTTCVFDLLQNQQVCEYPCAQTSDCPTLYTVCTGTSCTIDLCGVALGGPPNGTLDGPCNAAGTNDGTCLPVGTNDAGVTFGICTQEGTATTDCDAGATRSDPADACAQGFICGSPATVAGVATCYRVCDPNDMPGQTPCTPQQNCIAFNPPDPLFGVCYPP